MPSHTCVLQSSDSGGKTVPALDTLVTFFFFNHQAEATSESVVSNSYRHDREGCQGLPFAAGKLWYGGAFSERLAKLNLTVGLCYCVRSPTIRFLTQ